MIYLLRHGETHWNRLRRLQGQLDSPLTLRGIEHARTNGKRLREIIGEDLAGYEIVASPQGRAWQTATIVTETLGMGFDEIQLEPRLKEVGFGRWEGLSVAEIEVQDPELWRERMANKWNHTPPGGESYADVARRAKNWLDEQSAESRKIVVCHGLTGRVMRGVYGRLSEAETMAQGEDHSCFWRLTGGVVQEFSEDSG